MASSVNKVILVGNLGKDPEVRTTSNGGKIVSLTIATGEEWTDKRSGERKGKTEWHNVVIFNDTLADVAERFLTKGKKIYVEGQLQTRKYTDRSGVERYMTEVVVNKFNGALVLLTPPDTQATPRQPQRSGLPAREPVSTGPSWGEPTDELNDIIPF